MRIRFPTFQRSSSFEDSDYNLTTPAHSQYSTFPKPAALSSCDNAVPEPDIYAFVTLSIISDMAFAALFQNHSYLCPHRTALPLSASITVKTNHRNSGHLVLFLWPNPYVSSAADTSISCWFLWPSPVPLLPASSDASHSARSLKSTPLLYDFKQLCCILHTCVNQLKYSCPFVKTATMRVSVHFPGSQIDPVRPGAAAFDVSAAASRYILPA